MERARLLAQWNTWLSALLDEGHNDQEREKQDGDGGEGRIRSSKWKRGGLQLELSSPKGSVG